MPQKLPSSTTSPTTIATTRSTTIATTLALAAALLTSPAEAGGPLKGEAGRAPNERANEQASELVLDKLVIVGRAGAGAPWSDRPTEAALKLTTATAPESAPGIAPASTPGSAPELAVIALGKVGKRPVVIADVELESISLGGKPVAAARRLDWAALGADQPAFEWRLVEPRGFRSAPAKNGATSEYYSNVSTEPTSFGKWLGYDHIEYFETSLAPAIAGPAARRISALRPGTDERTPLAQKRALGTEHLGTLRYRVLALWRSGRALATPGAEATDAYGVLPSVHRVSIRSGEDFLGYLGAYLLVPEVFGSAGGGAQHQTERFTGADCADVMVGALRRSGRRDVPYTNVASLPQYATLVEQVVTLDGAGRSPRPLTAARPGDLIRIDYGGALVGHTPRGWDHVAAWWQDRSDPSGPHRGGADGQLDGFDLVIHMGHPRLVIEPLSLQSPATIDVLRWKPARGAARK